VPHLARSLSYWSDGSAFGFDMGDPRGSMNFIGYSSADRQDVGPTTTIYNKGPEPHLSDTRRAFTPSTGRQATLPS
jgi:hypothetical protein